MNSEILGRVSMDLLSVPPLIFRFLRKRLIKSTLADIDADIKLPHFEIMTVLKDEGTLHVAKIGEKLQIAKAQMTHLIDKLFELDLVARQIDVNDRRTLNITLTEKGSRMLEEHENAMLNAVKEKMSSLSGEELESLSISLRNLRDTLFKLETMSPRQ
jgi:DNA-binding MarR family transcriptional regulator